MSLRAPSCGLFPSPLVFVWVLCVLCCSVLVLCVLCVHSAPLGVLCTAEGRRRAPPPYLRTSYLRPAVARAPAAPALAARRVPFVCVCVSAAIATAAFFFPFVFVRPPGRRSPPLSLFRRRFRPSGRPLRGCGRRPGACSFFFPPGCLAIGPLYA